MLCGSCGTLNDFGIICVLNTRHSNSWYRNRINNPDFKVMEFNDFNYGEFAIIRKMTKNMKKIIIQNKEISVKISKDGDDYISLTDMAKFKDYMSGVVIQNWLTTKYTVQFMGGWEQLHNPNFNVLEFQYIRNEVGTNGFIVSPSTWIHKTKAIGIRSEPR